MSSKSPDVPTVVVADDDVEIIKLVRRLLNRRDVKMLEATDGEEALRVIRENRPELVILDVMMPGQTGWEVCRAIREDDSLSQTAVIMLTGIGERLNEMTSPLYGADAYLDKAVRFRQPGPDDHEGLGAARPGLTAPGQLLGGAGYGSRWLRFP